MSNSQLRYNFRTIDHCNMCGSQVGTHRILGKRLNKSQGKNPRKKTGITTTVVKCTNCNLIYSNPQPIPFDIQDHYNINPEDYWKEEYFTFQDTYFNYEIQKLKTILDFNSEMKSLDIGAGIGKSMLALSNAGFDAYGLEPSSQFYKMAISKMGINKERLKSEKLEEVNYPDGFFDFITFGAVLEHLYDPSEAILYALKWLKPKGIIHIEVPSSRWLINKIINLYYKITLTDYVGNISPMHEPFHLYEFGLKSFREHAKKHGYEITFHEYYVCETYMPSFTNFMLKPLMKYTGTGMQLVVWLRKK